MKYLSIFFIISIPLSLSASLLFEIPIGKASLSLEMLGPSYMPLDLNIPLKGVKIPEIRISRERDIYRYLVTHLPSFLVIEGSIYPLPITGVAIKSLAPDFYNTTEIWSNFNLIESVTVSFFKEPWAVSLFIGNVVNFLPLNYTNNFWTENLNGRGYSGILISYGNSRIKHNEIIPDDWIESELKLIGSYKSKKTEISWSYRLGFKANFNPLIDSFLYLGLRRDRLDRGIQTFSFIKNSMLDFEIDYNTDKTAFGKLTLIIGKKFPIRNKKWIPEINLGFIWQFVSEYNGYLNEATDTGFAFVFAPNIRF